VHAIRGQENEHNEIRNQEGDVEGVGVVETLKSLIQKMLANVLADTFWRGQNRVRQVQNVRGYEQGFRRSYSTGFDGALEVSASAAATCDTVGGVLIQRLGYRASFLGLAGIALIAFALLWLAVPETLKS
jgi:hypothetical protein